MFFLGVPFFSFLSFINSKFINCSKRFVLKCKIQTVRDRVFRSLRFVDAILILWTRSRDAVRFQTWISAKSLNIAQYNILTFHLNSKAFQKTEDRDPVVYRRWEDRFVHIRKKMVKFFFGSLLTKSEPTGEKRAGKNETNDSQHGPNKVFVIITI